MGEAGPCLDSLGADLVPLSYRADNFRTAEPNKKSIISSWKQEQEYDWVTWGEGEARVRSAWVERRSQLTALKEGRSRFDEITKVMFNEQQGPSLFAWESH